MKVIIIGNSGSGKTWLAERIASFGPTPIVHLDDLFWEPGGFDVKRSPEAIAERIELLKNRPAWVVEGVFGELAETFFDRADMLIWLDVEWPTCRDRLIRRGSVSKRHMGREESEEGLRRLIEWASRYDARTDMRSRTGHMELMERFSRTRWRIHTEADLTRLLGVIERQESAEGTA